MWTGSAGTTAVEYGLIIAGVGVAIIVAVGFLGSRVDSLFSGVRFGTAAVTIAAPSPRARPQRRDLVPLVRHPMAGGTTVTVVGRDFLPGATVQFGALPATITNREERWNGDIWLTVLLAGDVAARHPDRVPVTVRNPDGQTGTI